MADPAPAFEVTLTAAGDWLSDASGEAFDRPPTFDDLAHTSALVRYDGALDGRGGLLAFGEVRDRAWIEVDGVAVGTLSRTASERSLVIPAGERLTVLVEEQGRVNYDVRLGEPKGLIGAVTLDGAPLKGWTATPIDVASLAAAVEASVDRESGARATVNRAAWHGTFDLDAAADLFLDTDGWGKGYAFVNRFLLGRYWRSGPQRTLFVPAPVVRSGANTVVFVELERGTASSARFVTELNLGPGEE